MNSVSDSDCGLYGQTIIKGGYMPREDQTGPEGQGPLTGRRLGRCSGDKISTPLEGQGRRISRGNRGRLYPATDHRVNDRQIGKDTQHPTNLFDEILHILEEVRDLKNSLSNISTMVKKMKLSKKK